MLDNFILLALLLNLLWQNSMRLSPTRKPTPSHKKHANNIQRHAIFPLIAHRRRRKWKRIQ